MDVEKYFISLTNEFNSLKDRVRFYINDAHWASDGEWKESVLRSILRRHLPATIGVGKGFVISDSRISTQIDLLLYDKTRPILFQDGDFILITPDVAKGAIEVKTKIRKSSLVETLNKLADISELIHTDVLNHPRFFGVFSYEDDPSITTKYLLENLQKCVRGKHKRTIHCISLGVSRFMRFWEFDPLNHKHQIDKWYLYLLSGKAPAYFVHNAIDYLNPQWADSNNNIWYPITTKEPYKVDEIARNIE